MNNKNESKDNSRSIVGGKKGSMPLSVYEYINVGMKNTFNLTQPKFGLQGYEIKDKYMKD